MDFVFENIPKIVEKGEELVTTIVNNVSKKPFS